MLQGVEAALAILDRRFFADPAGLKWDDLDRYRLKRNIGHAKERTDLLLFAVRKPYICVLHEVRLCRFSVTLLKRN